jgi:uncharacterized protein YydD (DUF2326 family)
MQLSELTILRDGSVIRNIEFKQGLNLILDKPTEKPTATGNNLGKTTVLRLIDFCLGSDGNDIWEDSEFKTVNQDVYDFLHGQSSVEIRLDVTRSNGGSSTLRRFFAADRKLRGSSFIDEVEFRQVSKYREGLKLLLFSSTPGKPTMRQLAPKFVRSSPYLMSKTLRFLGDYGSETDYEALHLFLFGFRDVEVLEKRPRLAAEKKKLERDLQTLTRLRGEGEIEQLILHLQREVEQAASSTQLRSEVPEIRERANRITKTRAQAAQAAGTVSRYRSEISAIHMAIEELRKGFDGIDDRAIESIYRDAGTYLPKLHHDYKELREFVQNLRGRKERFLRQQANALEENAEQALRRLAELQAQENSEIGDLLSSGEFREALNVRADLEQKLKTLGSLEQDLQDVRALKAKLAFVESDLDASQQQIEKEKELLQDRVALFNRFFSELSQELYGEQYLLHFEETKRGSLSFQLSAVGANVGTGKKTSQTVAFDVAYISFLYSAGINFPQFVCHDGVESIHGNQLVALLTRAARLDGQLIIATLRDKLPAMSDGFIEQHTILELSQGDRLFRLGDQGVPSDFFLSPTVA